MKSRDKKMGGLGRKKKFIYVFFAIIVIVVTSLDICYKNTRFLGVKLEDYDIIHVICNGTVYPVDTKTNLIPKPLKQLEEYLYKDKVGITGLSLMIPQTDIERIKWAKEFDAEGHQKEYYLFAEFKVPQTIKVPSKYFGLKRKNVSSLLITCDNDALYFFWGDAEEIMYNSFMSFHGDKWEKERKKLMEIVRKLVE